MQNIKIYLLGCVCLFMLKGKAQNVVNNDNPLNKQYSTTCMYDTLTYNVWDTINNVWKQNMRDVNSYNNNLLTATIYQVWTGSNWIDFQRTSYTYNQGNKTTELKEYWNGTIWINMSLKNYAYSGSTCTSVINQSWYNSAWKNESKETYSYPHNIRITTWEVPNGTNWIILAQPNYVDTSDSLVVKTDSASCSSNLHSKMVYKFSGLSLTSYTYTTFSCGAMGGPFPMSQVIATYINNNISIKLTKICNVNSSGQSACNNKSQTTFSYNANNIMLGELVLAARNNTWIDSIRTDYTFCSNNICYDTGIHQKYKSSQWKNVSETTYNCPSIIGLSELSESRPILIYPNPANNCFTIETEKEMPITISNTLGETILNQQLQLGKNEINLSNHASGVYFITSGNSTFFKIIKQ